MTRIIKEIAIYVLCVLAALLVNAYAIAAFHTQWSEIFTTFHITLALALAFYIALAVLRILAFTFRRLFSRKLA